MSDTLKDYAEERVAMVEGQVAARGVTDERVLAALRRVPREEFVPLELRQYAYSDAPVAIGLGQTISQPYMVGLMLEMLKLSTDDVLLEVGAGSGYAAAVASLLCREVYGVERHPALASAAAARLRSLGLDNVTVIEGNGAAGLPDHAPYPAILVSAGGTAVPQPLLDQLAVGGRLVIPVGPTQSQQQLLRIRRTSHEHYETENFGAVAFVPLVDTADVAGQEKDLRESTP
jgi:protein-L-isoaspartate(D-aspartate) O-methyltransferase